MLTRRCRDQSEKGSGPSCSSRARRGWSRPSSASAALRARQDLEGRSGSARRRAASPARLASPSRPCRRPPRSRGQARPPPERPAGLAPAVEQRRLRDQLLAPHAESVEAPRRTRFSVISRDARARHEVGERAYGRAGPGGPAETRPRVRLEEALRRRGGEEAREPPVGGRGFSPRSAGLLAERSGAPPDPPSAPASGRPSAALVAAPSTMRRPAAISFG